MSVMTYIKNMHILFSVIKNIYIFAVMSIYKPPLSFCLSFFFFLLHPDAKYWCKLKLWFRFSAVPCYCVFLPWLFFAGPLLVPPNRDLHQQHPGPPQRGRSPQPLQLLRPRLSERHQHPLPAGLRRRSLLKLLQQRKV